MSSHRAGATGGIGKEPEPSIVSGSFQPGMKLDGFELLEEALGLGAKKASWRKPSQQLSC